MTAGILQLATWGLVLTAPPGTADTVARRRTPVVQVYEDVRDAVVNISSSVRLRPRVGIFEMFQQYAPNATSVGSGFVIHEDGYVVTNWHVVGQSTSHKVSFASGKDYDADLIAKDDINDIAVLKIRGEGPFKAVRLGRSEDLMVGETAVAIGNPFGYQNTVTTGVVSALHRDLQFESGVEYKDLIQTDASINHGNSGGPLLNIEGEVIGINTAIRADAQNIGFAIPVDRLRAALLDVLDAEKLRDVQVGMRVAGDRPRVTEVKADSPAAKAGIRLGDRLLGVGGSPVHRDVDFYIAMLGHKVGEHVGLKLERDGKPHSATLELTAVPKPDGKELAWKRLGVQIEKPSANVLRRLREYGIREDPGLIVTALEQRGPAERGEIQPGDLIVGVGRYAVRSTDDVGLLLRDVRSNDVVDVLFYRFFRGGIDQYRTRLYAQ